MKFFTTTSWEHNPKNKTQEACASLYDQCTGVLLSDQAALERFKAALEQQVSAINAAHPRCAEICFSSWSAPCEKASRISIGEVFRIIINPVKNEL